MHVTIIGGAKSGWKKLPEPEQLVWVVTNTEETRSMLMTKSNLDSVMDITLGAFEAIQQGTEMFKHGGMICPIVGWTLVLEYLKSTTSIHSGLPQV